MRRVVVTGIGLVSPLGGDAEISWQALVRGKSGAGAVTQFDVSDLPCAIACHVPRDAGGFNPDDWIEPKEQRRYTDFLIYGIAAADMALADAGCAPKNDAESERSGVMIGAGVGGLGGINDTALILAEKGARKVSPFFVPTNLINMPSGLVSIKHNLRGPCHSVVTACATGAHAIGDAARLIMLDDADMMVAGGTEASINRIGFAGFAACRALSTGFNDTPQKASRPFDKDRDGFVMGEGAGAVVLEELERAKARGAQIYGEVVGYGLSGDAYHMTSPAEDGNGGERAMRAALKRAELAPQDIDYINAHGTSTPRGDEIELRAVERLFGDAANGLLMSSTKSAIGHLLGAAGAAEAIFALLAMRDNIVPPTLNLDAPSIDTRIDLVPHTAREKKINTVLSNSFGFGGTNAALIFKSIA